jgi:hypothetical protein
MATPKERKPRGLTFKDKHLEEYGLKKINAAPVTVRCEFCYYFGREEKPGAKRKPSTNWTSFETGSFQTQNYRQHLTGCHPTRWAAYQELGNDSGVREAWWGLAGDAESSPLPITMNDKKRSPHKARGLGSKNQVKIDNLAETFVAELKKLKDLASMSDDPEVYGEGKKILSFIRHVEEGRAKHGI